MMTCTPNLITICVLMLLGYRKSAEQDLKKARDGEKPITKCHPVQSKKG